MGGSEIKEDQQKGKKEKETPDTESNHSVDNKPSSQEAQVPPELEPILSDYRIPDDARKKISQVFATFMAFNRSGPLPPDPETAKTLARTLEKDSDNYLTYQLKKLEIEEKNNERGFEMGKAASSHVRKLTWAILLIIAAVAGTGLVLAAIGKTEGWTILTHGLAAIGGAGGWKLMSHLR